MPGKSSSLAAKKQAVVTARAAASAAAAEAAAAEAAVPAPVHTLGDLCGNVHTLLSYAGMPLHPQEKCTPPRTVIERLLYTDPKDYVRRHGGPEQDKDCYQCDVDAFIACFKAGLIEHDKLPDVLRLIGDVLHDRGEKAPGANDYLMLSMLNAIKEVKPELDLRVLFSNHDLSFFTRYDAWLANPNDGLGNRIDSDSQFHTGFVLSDLLSEGLVKPDALIALAEDYRQRLMLIDYEWVHDVQDQKLDFYTHAPMNLKDDLEALFHEYKLGETTGIDWDAFKQGEEQGEEAAVRRTKAFQQLKAVINAVNKAFYQKQLTDPGFFQQVAKADPNYSGDDRTPGDTFAHIQAQRYPATCGLLWVRGNEPDYKRPDAQPGSYALEHHCRWKDLVGTAHHGHEGAASGQYKTAAGAIKDLLMSAGIVAKPASLSLLQIKDRRGKNVDCWLIGHDSQTNRQLREALEAWQGGNDGSAFNEWNEKAEKVWEALCQQRFTAGDGEDQAPKKKAALRAFLNLSFTMRYNDAPEQKKAHVALTPGAMLHEKAGDLPSTTCVESNIYPPAKTLFAAAAEEDPALSVPLASRQAYVAKQLALPRWRFAAGIDTFDRVFPAYSYAGKLEEKEVFRGWFKRHSIEDQEKMVAHGPTPMDLFCGGFPLHKACGLAPNPRLTCFTDKSSQEDERSEEAFRRLLQRQPKEQRDAWFQSLGEIDNLSPEQLSDWVSVCRDCVKNAYDGLDQGHNKRVTIFIKAVEGRLPDTLAVLTPTLTPLAIVGLVAGGIVSAPIGGIAAAASLGFLGCMAFGVTVCRNYKDRNFNYLKNTPEDIASTAAASLSDTESGSAPLLSQEARSEQTTAPQSEPPEAAKLKALMGIMDANNATPELQESLDRVHGFIRSLRNSDPFLVCIKSLIGTKKERRSSGCHTHDYVADCKRALIIFNIVDQVCKDYGSHTSDSNELLKKIAQRLAFTIEHRHAGVRHDSVWDVRDHYFNRTFRMPFPRGSNKEDARGQRLGHRSQKIYDWAERAQVPTQGLVALRLGS